MEKLSFEDGKYQLILDAGEFTALRHGQPWRDLTGDKLVYTMFAEIQGLQAETESLRTGYEAARLEIASLQAQLEAVGAGHARSTRTTESGGVMTTDWKPITDDQPAQKEVVETCIKDATGVRNHQPLLRQGRLWFFPDMSMYVYYTPTHWRPKP